MKVLKFIFYIPYWVVYCTLWCTSCIFSVMALLWNALGVKMGFDNIKLKRSGAQEAWNNLCNFINEEDE